MEVITNITGYKRIHISSVIAGLRFELTKEQNNFTDTIDFLILKSYGLLSLKIYPTISQGHFTDFILK